MFTRLNNWHCGPPLYFPSSCKFLLISCKFFTRQSFLLTPNLTELCRQERTSRYHFTVTWKHCQTSLGKLLPTLYSGIRSAVASCDCSSVFAVAMKLWRLSLSLLVLVFNIDFVFPRRPHLESVSLLDLDACNSGEISKSSKYFDQMKDLMSFDEDVMDSTKKTLNQGKDIRSSMRTKDSSNILHQESSVANLGVVKRR